MIPKRWLNRLQQIQVSPLVLALAVLCLGCGILPWYHLPIETLVAFQTNLNATLWGRVAAAGFAVLCLKALFTGFLKRWLRLSLWLGLLLALLFPYWITTWSPAVAFVATAYYDQGIIVSRHVERTIPEAQARWKQNMVLMRSSDRISVTRSLPYLVISDGRFFQLPAWDSFLSRGLGYSNSFFAFIGRGWIFTVIGLGLGLMGCYLGLQQPVDDFLKDMSRFLPGASAVLGLLVCSVILPNFATYQLDTLMAKGQYSQVIAICQQLERWYPPIQGDRNFLRQMAEAKFYMNQPDLGLIDFAKGLENYRLGDFVQAEANFRSALALQPQRFLIRGYLAATLLNQGIDYFNNPSKLNSLSNRRPGDTRLPGGAIDRFEQVLQVFPYHVEALYGLMIATATNGEFGKSAAVAQSIIDFQRYAQRPSIALLGQAYLHKTWSDFQKGDLAVAWKRYRQSVDASAWKKPVESNP